MSKDDIIDEVRNKLCKRDSCKGIECLHYISQVHDCFGVFVSVKFEGIIYSCLGSWYENVLKTEEIYEIIMSLCNSILHGRDSRSLQFDEFNMDKAKIEIYFMQMSPVKDVVLENDFFDNDVYGLIVSSNVDGKKATFLPQVFGRIKWDIISSSLKHKAGIDDDNVTFSVYKSHII